VDPRIVSRESNTELDGAEAENVTKIAVANPKDKFTEDVLPRKIRVFKSMIYLS